MERLDVHVHQDERLIRSMVLMGNNVAEISETLNLLGAAMSALSDAVDALISRVANSEQVDKARIADLEQQLADVPAQIARLDQIDAPVATPDTPLVAE